MIKDYAEPGARAPSPDAALTIAPPALPGGTRVAVHPAFTGDCSLYAGPGRGLAAVPEYKPPQTK